MAYLWKQVLYPTTTPLAGSHYTAPHFIINDDGTIIVMTELVGGADGSGPYPLTAPLFSYDNFGNAETGGPSINVVPTGTTIPDSTTLSDFYGSDHFATTAPGGLNGGVAFYVTSDGLGDWVINSDVLTVNDANNAIVQTHDVVDNTISEADDTILGLFASSRADGTYGVSYAVYYNQGTNAGKVDILWQGYNADGTKANASPVSLVGGPQTVDSDPAADIHPSAGAYGEMLEYVNSGDPNLRYIHFQGFDVNGTPDPTKTFDLRANNTVVNDITEIRFSQYTSSVTHSPYVVVDDETHNNGSGYFVELTTKLAQVSMSGTTIQVANTTNEQHVQVSLVNSDETIFVGYGDKDGDGATINEYNTTDTGTALQVNLVDSYTISGDGRFIEMLALGDGRVAVTFQKTIDAGTSATQDVMDFVDFRTPGQTIDLHSESTGGQDNIAGTSGNDTITGSDTDFDYIAGAGGSDAFIIDQAQYTAQNIPEITDYDQGNTGTFSSVEGDSIDISAITQAAVDSGQATHSLVHVIDDGLKGTFLVVDADGTTDGTQYLQAAQLDGIHAGHTVQVVTDSAAPSGVTIGVESNQGFAGNFNSGSDNNSDFIWRNDDGHVSLWEMDGNTHVGGGAIADLPTSWTITGIGDFNNDGNSDLVLQNLSGALSIWEMNGTSHSGGLVATLPISWNVEGTGDFNGDGKSDLVLRNDNGAISIWEMNGNVHTGGGAVGNPGLGWHIEGVGDFNGDGKSDLVLRNDNGATVIWEMNGNVHTGGGSIGSLPDNWHLAGTGDFNGDGKSDLVWRADTGAVVVWEMNGTNHIGGGSVGNLGANWSTQAHHYDVV